MDGILFVWAFFAEIAGTITWFGSSSIFLPIAHQFFDFYTALTLVAVYHIFGNLSRLMAFYRYWDRRIFFLFGIPSVFATVAGALLAQNVDQNILKVILGCVLISFASYSLARPSWRLPANALFARLWGALSGFTAGLIGTGGVLRGACMSGFWLPKETYIATIASIALLVDFTRIPLYLEQGFLSSKHIPLMMTLFVVAIVGSFMGKKILSYIPQEASRKMILAAIILMSGYLTWQGISRM